MTSIEALVAEYPGKDAWSHFARAWRANDDEITSVAGAVLGGETASWFAQPIPALDNRSPAAVLRDHPQGTDIVRSLLMRMP